MNVQKIVANSPYAFVPFGKPPEVQLSALLNYLNEKQIQVESSLFSFWEDFGGGYLYETELFFAVSPQMPDNVYLRNQVYWRNGLSNSFFVFYEGFLELAALDKDAHLFLLSENNFSVKNKLPTFSSLLDILNKEYSDRYDQSRGRS